MCGQAPGNLQSSTTPSSRDRLNLYEVVLEVYVQNYLLLYATGTNIGVAKLRYIHLVLNV